MSSSVQFASAPAMWAIERPAQTGKGSVLRLGQRRIPISSIRRVERREHAERDVKGLLIMGGLFLVCAFIFAVGVADIGWRTRFLLGAVILLALAVISVVETVSVPPVRFVELRFSTSEGEVVFTTADPADATALQARIAAEQRAQTVAR